MWLRALLLCDDVRLEIGKTVTAVGIHSDHIYVNVAQGPITLPRLAVLAIVAGLRGLSQITWRQTLTTVGGDPSERGPMRVESHDPESDEHHIISLLSPATFSEAGQYQISLELEAGGESICRDVVFSIGPPTSDT